MLLVLSFCTSSFVSKSQFRLVVLKMDPGFRLVIFIKSLCFGEKQNYDKKYICFLYFYLIQNFYEDFFFADRIVFHNITNVIFKTFNHFFFRFCVFIRIYKFNTYPWQHSFIVTLCVIKRIMTASPILRNNASQITGLLFL